MMKLDSLENEDATPYFQEDNAFETIFKKSAWQKQKEAHQRELDRLNWKKKMKLN